MFWKLAIAVAMCAATLVATPASADTTGSSFACGLQVGDGAVPTVDWTESVGANSYVVERMMVDRFWWRGVAVAAERTFTDSALPGWATGVQYRVTAKGKKGQVLGTAECVPVSPLNCHTQPIPSGGYMVTIDNISQELPGGSIYSLVYRRQVTEDGQFFWRAKERRYGAIQYFDSESPTGEATYRVAAFNPDGSILTISQCRVPTDFDCARYSFGPELIDGYIAIPIYAYPDGERFLMNLWAEYQTRAPVGHAIWNSSTNTAEVFEGGPSPIYPDLVMPNGTLVSANPGSKKVSIYRPGQPLAGSPVDDANVKIVGVRGDDLYFAGRESGSQTTDMFKFDSVAETFETVASDIGLLPVTGKNSIVGARAFYVGAAGSGLRFVDLDDGSINNATRIQDRVADVAQGSISSVTSVDRGLLVFVQAADGSAVAVHVNVDTLEAKVLIDTETSFASFIVEPARQTVAGKEYVYFYGSGSGPSSFTRHFALNVETMTVVRAATQLAERPSDFSRGSMRFFVTDNPPAPYWFNPANGDYYEVPVPNEESGFGVLAGPGGKTYFGQFVLNEACA